MRHAMRFGLLGLLAIGLLLNDSMFAQESMCWSLTGYVNNNTNIGYYYPYDELKAEETYYLKTGAVEENYELGFEWYSNQGVCTTSSIIQNVPANTDDYYTRAQTVTVELGAVFDNWPEFVQVIAYMDSYEESESDNWVSGI